MTDADTNRIIAEAMGWKFVDHHPAGRTCKHAAFHPGRYGWHQKPDELELWSCAHCQESSAPDYLHDPNAALEAAGELCGAYTLTARAVMTAKPYLFHAKCELGSGEGNDPAAALCAMILADLAERKDAT